MNHDDHVALIAGAFEQTSERMQQHVWADFGAGSGAFTLAIRDLAGPDCEIYALDQDRSALETLRAAMIRMFPETYLQLVDGDIRQPPPLPPLDGIVAANSLHYVERKRQPATLRLWSTLLKPGGRIVLVEYDSNEPNPWVPFPISWRRLRDVAHDAGLPPPERLGAHPSRWNGGIYSAMIENGPAAF
jgi:ubiquinone/menaquinone biosynthesis C-methylase UbiE